MVGQTASDGTTDVTDLSDGYDAASNATGERAVMVTGGTVGHGIFDADGTPVVTFKFHLA